jgi:hypothetical protein
VALVPHLGCQNTKKTVNSQIYQMKQYLYLTVDDGIRHIEPLASPLPIPEEVPFRNLTGSDTVRNLQSVRRRPVFSSIRLALQLPRSAHCEDDLPSNPVKRVWFDRSIFKTPRAGGVPE